MAGLPWIRSYTSIRTDPRSLVLGRMLGDSHAYARILDLRLWLADNAPDGVVPGPHAEVVVEEAVGWRGEPGAFAKAAMDSGFLRAAPVRDLSGSGAGYGLEDVDWADEQAAHLAKVERDRKKPDGRRKSRAAPVRDLSGESRELRVESTSPSEETASPTAAVAASSSGDDLPDATADAEEVATRPDLVLEAQVAGKRVRKPSAAEALFARLEARRKEKCAEHGVDFVETESGWPSARINRDLGPIARAEKAEGPEWARFCAAWWEFLDDPAALAADVPLSLNWFWKERDRYYGRSLKSGGGQ